MCREMALGIGDSKEEVRWTFSGEVPDYRRHCTVNEEEVGGFAFVEGKEGGLGEGILLLGPLS